MIDQALEKLSARADRRFAVFVEGKRALEEFNLSMKVYHEDMTEEHYQLARSSPLLPTAERCFREAVHLSEEADALVDISVGKYELGLIYHACGRLSEAYAEFHTAAEMLRSMPTSGLREIQNLSACLYHLGVIALKQGRMQEAVRELQHSKRLDEANGDYTGVMTDAHALRKCAALGEAIDQKLFRSPYEDRSWVPSPDSSEVRLVEEAAASADTSAKESTRQRIFVRRLAVLLISQEEKINDTVMAALSTQGEAFGRPVNIHRLAYAARDHSKRQPAPLMPDQHLCAAVLVIERAGLSDPAFHEWASFCISRVRDTPDFRLFIYLEDMTLDDLRNYAGQRTPAEQQSAQEVSALIESLFASTQVAQWTSYDTATGSFTEAARQDSLRRMMQALVVFIQRVEQIRASARWQRFRGLGTRILGKLAALLLWGSAGGIAITFIALILHLPLQAALGKYGPALTSLLLGLLIFPLNAPILHLLLRGWRATMIAPYQNQKLMTKLFPVCFALLWGGSYVQQQYHGGHRWVALGFVAGVLLDHLRRTSYQAARLSFKLNPDNPKDQALLKSEQWSDPQQTVRKHNLFPPIFCPLLTKRKVGVFISYSQRSAEVSQFATALYHDLRKVGNAVFLDRASIPVGANWLQELDEHLSRCQVFICILDAKAVQSPWVAAEILAALKSRHWAAAPEVIVLMDPALHPSAPMLPVFQGLLSQLDEPQLPGQPQILRLSKYSREGLAWSLRAPRYVPTTIFSPILSALFALCVWTPLLILGYLCFFIGFFVAFFIILENNSQLPFTSAIVQHTYQVSAALFFCYCLGYSARMYLAGKFESHLIPTTSAFIAGLSFFGYAAALVKLVPHLTPYCQGWAILATVIGWLMVTILPDSLFNPKTNEKAVA